VSNRLVASEVLEKLPVVASDLEEDSEEAEKEAS
jgi:hypothetical protein